MLLQELTQLLTESPIKPKIVKHLTAIEALKFDEAAVSEFLSGWRDEDSSLNSKTDDFLLKRMYQQKSEFALIKIANMKENLLAQWSPKEGLDSMLVWEENYWSPLDGY